ncbi:hypothetical protein I7I50_03785 [Histoplasma capsulatum G186AR]|uniref:Uncharacterized protein n=1 Tax=Ajellomyces capsulatus TaxID=5037 RepID=A0A8H7YPR3_AJECA|nr:hypothetical protein I7I52_04692 [Histoplasma capsulatum]QSS74850.1 hypothetical protein I7I50_03785 [Histoplasma capsulatum G186AR]
MRCFFSYLVSGVLVSSHTARCNTPGLLMILLRKTSPAYQPSIYGEGFHIFKDHDEYDLKEFIECHG